MTLEKTSPKDALVWAIAVCLAAVPLVSCGHTARPTEKRIMPEGAVVLRAVRHRTDGYVSELTQEEAEEFYLNPENFSWRPLIKCVHEDMTFHFREFEWVKTGENVWDWRIRRLRELYPIRLKGLHSYPLRQESQGVLVIADPYFDQQKLARRFSGAWNAIDEFVYPIHLIVQNQERKEVFLSAKNTQFLWPGYDAMPPGDAHTVYERLKYELAESPGYSGYVVDEAKIKNFATEEDFAIFALEDGRLPKGHTLSGFLFFVMPKYRGEIEEGRLDLTLLATDTKEEIKFEIPIPREYFKVAEEERSSPFQPTAKDVSDN